MGKIKRNKNNPRKNVCGVSKRRNISTNEDELSTPSELSIQTAKEQLQATLTHSNHWLLQFVENARMMPHVEDKLCGLQTLATLLESKDYESILVKQSIVRTAAPLLVDNDSNIRNATAGTLRNFSALGLDACEYLVSQDIMTPLIAFFKKYADDWVPKKTVSGKLDEDADTFLHCVNLLWNLSESSGISVKYFNNCNLIAILTRCLDIEAFGTEMVVAILHCLFTITEDNPQAIEAIKSLSEHTITKIFSLETETPIILLLRILSAGIIINTYADDLKALPIDIVNKILSTISATLSVDLRSACNELSSVLPLNNATTESTDNKQSQKVQSQADNVKHLIDAQQTAVEILTNLCSCDDLDETMETDNVSDEDSEMEDDNNFDVCTNNDANNFCSIESLPIEITEHIVSFNIIDKVMTLTNLPAENVLQILDESETGKNVYKRLCILQSRSLLCLNNLISNLSLEIIGGPEKLYKIWVDTGKRIFQNSVPYSGEDILESASAVMRASLEKLKNDPEKSFNHVLIRDLSVTDIKFILDGIVACPYLEIRANLTRMIGNVGLILTTKPECLSSQILLTICEFLLDRMFKETECWLLAEVIDTVMDLFSEDETDSLAKQIQLVDKLNAVKSTFRSKVRQQKKTLGDHTAVVSTVVTNLPRFIDYKLKRTLSLQ